MPKDRQAPPQSPTPTPAPASPTCSAPLLDGMDEPLFGDPATQAALERVIAAQRAAKAKKDR